MNCETHLICHKARILDVFTTYSKMLQEQKQNRFKVNAAKSIVKGLQYYPATLKNEEDIKSFMKHLGKKNAKKTVLRMLTIMEKGELPEVTEYFANRNHTKFDTLDELTSIYGIGPAKATYLMDKCGVTSLENLKEKLKQDNTKHALKLTQAQKLGVTHYQDLRTRIPRSEIKKYETKLKKCIQTIDPEANICITGSYRRGETSSGDVDMLVSSPNTINMEVIVEKLSSMVVGILAQGEKKSMLLTRLTNKSKVRHMDIIITSPTQYPFAQLYFTGSKMFNIRMRQHALQMGYTLNEYKLTNVSSDSPPAPAMYTEKDIFTFLDYPYVEPTKRSQ